MAWKILPGLINSILLLGISAIHFYWALGGKWGIEKTLPTNLEGKKMLSPKKIDSALVAIFLLCFAILFLIKVELLPLHLPQLISRFGIGVISAIFLLRAFGDLRYIGFTKKITSTDFARRDTQFYSPLCLLIGINGMLTELFF